MQKQIVEEMKVKPVIDVQEEIRTRIDFMKNELIKNKYHVEESLISPVQFGIPQTRLRMYILAIKKKNIKDLFQEG